MSPELAGGLSRARKTTQHVGFQCSVSALGVEALGVVKTESTTSSRRLPLVERIRVQLESGSALERRLGIAGPLENPFRLWSFVPT